MSAEVPLLLPPEIGVVPTAYGQSYTVGTIAIDPYMLLFLATPLAVPMADAGVRAAALEAERPAIDAFDPEGGAVSIGPAVSIRPGGHPGLVRSWRYTNGLLYHRFVVVTPTHDVLLEMLAWDAYANTVAIGERVAGSVTPL